MWPSARIATSRSRGGNSAPRALRRVVTRPAVAIGAWARLALVVALTATASPGLRAATLQEAQAAFDRADFDRAQAVWRDLAAGDGKQAAEAAFQLGLLYDLGLGEAPDPTKARRWYLEAANLGQPAAQFNVGVMLDAGTGEPRNPAAAAIWYARAAANGLARAQYNLALLYESGDGVPRNLALARGWLRRAEASLPAASARLAGLDAIGRDAADTELSAPVQLATATTPAEEADTAGHHAELVWSAAEEPAGTHFFVEVAGLRDRSDQFQYLDVSAVSIRLLAAGQFAWRVLAVDPAERRYAAAPWRPFAVGGPADPARWSPPKGRVVLRYGSGDANAQAFAAELSDAFLRNGFLVETKVAETERFAQSAVHYFFTDDADLAGSVTMFLPVLRAEDAAILPAADAPRPPGTVEVDLSGGPTP